MAIDGDPASDPSHIHRVVFKQGVGYAPERLLAAVRGRVGTVKSNPLACPSPASTPP